MPTKFMRVSGRLLDTLDVIDNFDSSFNEAHNSGDTTNDFEGHDGIESILVRQIYWLCLR